MHELSDRELFQAIEYAKSIDEESGRAILEKFQTDQPGLAQTIFNIFPSVIAEQNKDMAYLFMDMCFDVICIYQHAFGQAPALDEMNPDWLEKQVALLEAELQAIMPKNVMNTKFRDKLQKRMVQRANDETIQHGLIKFMNAWIDEFAAETPGGTEAIEVTQKMMLVVIRLFNNLYTHP
ncbi:hypothetical protein [Thiolapillus sp.]|uniref:hypothetical protein n=1 Tax=Thiolapillus sp. TaxID=2017437 RepID=UPI003AF6612D